MEGACLITVFGHMGVDESFLRITDIKPYWIAFDSFACTFKEVLYVYALLPLLHRLVCLFEKVLIFIQYKFPSE